MQIREFMGADFEAVAKVLGSLWHTMHGDHSFWQGADELCDHLARADKGFVAQDEDGSLLGVILLASPNAADHNDTMRMHWLQQRTRLAAMANALGINARADVGVLNEENELMRRYDERFGADGVGEVVLLVVVPTAKGKGVGTRLLNEGLAWLKSRGATSLRLITDDDCDWQYYDYLGMERLLEEESRVEPGLRLYIYGQRL